MRKIREVLRLKWQHDLSHRQIGRSVRLGHGTVCNYLLRAKVEGLSWEQVAALTDAELEQRLYPRPRPKGGQRALPDWTKVHGELKKKGVTLSLLWQEYREDHPDGYGLSRFCQLYRIWEGRLDVCLRQDYRAGEKLFVDYAGQTVRVVDPASGKTREAQIFVAVLGASNFTFAEATWSQGLEDRLSCADLRGSGRGERAGGAGQSEERRDQPVPLRAGDQSHLRGVGRALRRGGGAGAGEEAPRQGEGRKWCIASGALDSGPAA